MDEILKLAAQRAIDYLKGLENRRVSPTPEAIHRLKELGCILPEYSSDPKSVLDLLDQIGSPATVASAGGRYFGFVVGGSLPAALAANWIAGAWDQVASLYATSPVAATLEEITAKWILELLCLAMKK